MPSLVSCFLNKGPRIFTLMQPAVPRESGHPVWVHVPCKCSGVHKAFICSWGHCPCSWWPPVPEPSSRTCARWRPRNRSRNPHWLPEQKAFTAPAGAMPSFVGINHCPNTKKVQHGGGLWLPGFKFQLSHSLYHLEQKSIKTYSSVLAVLCWTMLFHIYYFQPLQ